MKENICIHFCGINVECCKAGVHLRQLFDDKKPGIGTRIPCIQDGRDCRATCKKLRLPTPEEIAKNEAETKALMARYEKAGLLVLQRKAEHRGESWSGVEVCPVCGGKLHLQIAAYNGHARGCCETDGCLKFWE